MTRATEREVRPTFWACLGKRVADSLAGPA